MAGSGEGGGGNSALQYLNAQVLNNDKSTSRVPHKVCVCVCVCVRPGVGSGWGGNSALQNLNAQVLNNDKSTSRVPHKVCVCVRPGVERGSREFSSPKSKCTSSE